MHRPPFLTALRLRGALCLAAALASGACFQSKPGEVAGGGGIETTDGEITASTGSPAAGVRVRMVPEGWSPLANDPFPAAFTAVTDAAGRYAFHGLKPGRYALEAADPADGTRLLQPDLVLAPAAVRTLPAAALARTGSLRLLWEPSHRGYLYVRGTTLLHRIATADIEAPSILIDSLPKGMLPPVRWSESLTDTIGIAITDSVPIVPDSITERTVFAGWAHEGAWDADSTLALPHSTEADSFPLLLRLAAPDFDFAQADSDGHDLRFTDPEGKPLGYVIGSWDPAAGRAGIWVRVALRRLRAPGEAVRMHWGNPDADNRSQASAVFSAGNGFAGVWHLDEAANSKAGGYADGTGSGRLGTGINLIAAPAEEGVIGAAQRFNGVDQRITITGSYPTNRAPRCLSAWAKSSAPTAQGHLIAYGSSNNLASFGAWNDGGTWTAWHWGPANDMHTPVKADTAWHHVAVDYDGDTTRFYIDGALVESGARALITTANGFTIGSSFTPDRFWTGLVDEAQASQVSRSAGWIKAAYETQRPGSTALRFRVLK